MRGASFGSPEGIQGTKKPVLRDLEGASRGTSPVTHILKQAGCQLTQVVGPSQPASDALPRWVVADQESWVWQLKEDWGNTVSALFCSHGVPVKPPGSWVLAHLQSCQPLPPNRSLPSHRVDSLRIQNALSKGFPGFMSQAPQNQGLEGG